MSASGIKSRRLDSIVPEHLVWLADGLIAVGKLNILAGMPGCGKSLMTCSFASSLSKAAFWFPAKRNLPQTRVLMIGGEDDIGDTVLPRLIAEDANLTNIEILDNVFDDQTNQERSFSLDTDLPLLREKIISDNIGMVIIDPITGFLGKRDAYKDSEIRALLIPLAQLAAELKITVLAIMHLNKGQNNAAMKQVSGSIAFVGVARNVIVLAKDPADPSRRILVSAKTNIGKDGTAHAFRVEPVSLSSGIETARISWLDEKVAITADELLLADASAGVGSLSDAEDFLNEALKNGPLDSVQLFAEAALNDISIATLRRAKKSLKVVADRIGGAAAAGKWQWKLPTYVRIP